MEVLQTAVVVAVGLMVRFGLPIAILFAIGYWLERSRRGAALRGMGGGSEDAE